MSYRAWEPNAIGNIVPPFGGGPGGGSGPSTSGIRDAHVIVVAQAGYLATLGGLASPPLPANQLNLAAGPGDTASLTCDYLDTGDGAQLVQALAAAAAAGVPIDIRLRPCALVLTGLVDSPGGFTIPVGCRLIGAGARLSGITGTTGIKGQTILNLDVGARVEELTILSPAPTEAPAASTAGVIRCAESAEVVRCRVSLKRSAAFNRIAINGIIFNSATGPAGFELVEDCELYIDSMRGQPAPVGNAAVLFGTTAQTITTDCDAEVRNTFVDESTKNAGSATSAVQFLNWEGGRCINVEHLDADYVQSFSWAWTFTPAGAVVREIRGPRWIDCQVFAAPISPQLAGNQTGFLMALAGTPNLTGGVRAPVLRNCFVQFHVPAVADAGADLVGFAIRNAADIGDIYDTSVDGCKVEHAQRGFVIEGSSTGRVESVRMTGCQARDCIAGGVSPPKGVHLIGNAIANNATVIQVGIVNGDFTGMPATGIAVHVANIRVENTIIVGNNLTPNGGVAITDAGTGTQPGLNIL